MVARTGHPFGRAWAVLATGLLVALMAALPTGFAAAQDASPVASPATEEADALVATGLPQITVRAQEFTFSPNVPGAMLEGWYLITLENQTDALASANLALLPEGQSVGDLTSTLSSSFKGEGGELPEWWSSATFAGGNVAAGGETTHTLAYLTPGKWVVFSTNPAAIQSPSVITILTPDEAEANYGIAPEASPVASPVAGAQAPEGVSASTTVDVSDSGITAGTATAGAQVVEVTNSGEQAHDLVFVKADDTADEAAAATLAGSFARGEDLAGAMVVGGVGALGPGQAAYASVTLEAGTYVVFSSMPDANGGLQADAGVVTVLTVG